MSNFDSDVEIFQLNDHPLTALLQTKLGCGLGRFNARNFPDGESYLQIESTIQNKKCIVLVDLARPNDKYLPLLFMLETLKELGANMVGLVAPYLPYMRQDRRFLEGEAITSKIFASSLSHHVDWLITVDPHLHRYHSLDEIYSVPTSVIQGAPALAQWLSNRTNVFLVGPDSESEQWVSSIADSSNHDFVIGQKNRRGDRDVKVTLPDLSRFQGCAAIIIDDVISSGQTILECAASLGQQGIDKIQCAAIHGIFADQVDKQLLSSGIQELVTCNTIAHESNKIDVSDLLLDAIKKQITKQ